MQIRLRLVGAIVAAICATSGAHAAANFVTNGDFTDTTTNLAGWTQIGDTSALAANTCSPGFGAGDDCAAFFSTLGTATGIAQTLTGLTAGKAYSVSFEFLDSTAYSTNLDVTFGGQTLINKAFDPDPTAAYTNYTFHVVAAAGTQTLSFLTRDDTDFVQLDSVKVSAVPEPDSLAMIAAGLAGVGFMRRRRSSAAKSGLGLA